MGLLGVLQCRMSQEEYWQTMTLWNSEDFALPLLEHSGALLSKVILLAKLLRWARASDGLDQYRS